MKSEYSPRQMADFEKSRAISDAELLKTGANYEINEATGEKELTATPEQIDIISQTVERLLADGIMTPESLQTADLEIDFDGEGGDIGYEFELEEEQRIMVNPESFVIKEWKNHVVDVYDSSGRCRIRLKNGEPRMSLKVPLMSRDTAKSKCCVRMEFKPRKKRQREDLLTIVELIAQEPNTQIHEKWGTPLKLNNGEKVWINKNDRGEYWIETDIAENIEDLLPEGIIFLGHRKSSIKLPAEKQTEPDAVIEKLSSLATVREKLGDPEVFSEIFSANQKTLSRTAKGKIDISVSDSKQNAELSGKRLEDQIAANLQALLEYIKQNQSREFDSAKQIKKLVEDIVTIINNGIYNDPLALRSWEVRYGRLQKPEGIEKEMGKFYESLLEKLADVRSDKADAIGLAAWIEAEINREIHPYADGCGRSSQALAAFFLNHFQAPLPGHDSREEYYQAMNGGPEAFVKYYYRATERSLVKNYLNKSK